MAWARDGMTVCLCAVIDLERMKPELLLREHTFLCNPRTPASVLSSSRNVSAALAVTVAPDGSNAEAARVQGMALVRKLQKEMSTIKVRP